MPTAANLSRPYCDTLGVEVANKLVEQRIAELRTELRAVRSEIQQIRTELPWFMFGFWITAVVLLGTMMLSLQP